jgi:hypothetical protein
MASAADPLETLRNSWHAGIKGVGSGRFTPPSDVGNTIGTAHALTLSNLLTASLNGKIDYQGDVDVYSVVAKNTDVMTVVVNSGPNGVLSAATFMDGSGQAIEPLTAEFGGPTPRYTYTLDVVSGQKYFVAVSAVTPLATGSYSVSVGIALPPPTAKIVAVTPGHRHTAVPSMKIVFSRPVSGVSLAALALTSSDGANLLTSAQTLTTSDHITYTLGNLGSLTGRAGGYTLSLDPTVASITDQLGNPLGSGAIGSFAVDTTAPTVAVVPVTPSPRNSAVSQLQFVFSEAVAGVKLSSLKLT